MDIKNPFKNISFTKKCILLAFCIICIIFFPNFIMFGVFIMLLSATYLILSFILKNQDLPFENISFTKKCILVAVCVICAIFFPNFVLFAVLVALISIIYLALLFIFKKDNIPFSVLKTSDLKMLEASPIPYCILNENGDIQECNKEFKDSFGSDSRSKHISSIIPEINLKEREQILESDNKYYKVFNYKRSITIGKNFENKIVYSILFVDISECEILRKKLKDNHCVAGYIFVDNYDEVVESIDDTSIPLFTAVIDRKLNTIAEEIGAILKKLEKDRYILVISEGSLEKLKENKFEILNDIRDISIGDHIPPTLSIGIGVEGDNLFESLKEARAAIDLALGRGGDQALIKYGDNYSFYGGKTGEVSHNARIRARVKADALIELIEDSGDIFVMGHRHTDLDSLGSALGVFRIAKSYDKNCRIILDEVSDGIKKLYERLEEDDSISSTFISSSEASSKFKDDTLLVVVDTHKPSITESSNIIKLAKKIVVFDHHRRGTESIENPVLIYHEPYASSTSELVTEMIEYLSGKVKLRTIEADALLAGITMDTKNFFDKTGARTFEAAAFLKRNGADSARVRLLFRNNLEVYKARASAVKDAEIYEGGIAISICRYNEGNSGVVAAQTADDLLSVDDIKASFVVCEANGQTYVSARSLGEINVQLIMERLGGGGHRTIAGVQLDGTEPEGAIILIKQAIKEYLQEEMI